MTLSHIITSLIEEFLPALHYKYVYKNFKQSDLYWTYNPTVVPPYLQYRPKLTILHCLHRQASSNKFAEIDVKDTDTDGMFHVQGKNKTHVVDFGVVSGEPTCTCKDWLAHQIPCKHFFGVFRLRPEWGWEKLPHSYLQSPYLTLDDKAITEYVKLISTSPDKSCQHDLCEGPSSPAPSTPPDHTSEVETQ